MNVAHPRPTPVQWMGAFAYTPDSARVRSGDRHAEDRVPLSDADALPTRFHFVSGVPNPGRDPVRGGDGSEAYVSDPCLTARVPATRKRQSGGRERPSLSLASITDGLSATQGPFSRRTRSRTRCSSTNGGSGHGRGLGPSHAPAPSTPTRPRSRRVVLDAVEIVRKERSGDRMADPERPTESARKTASSHYPSPPASCARRDVTVHEGHASAHVPHPNTAEREEHVSSERLPLTTSKYFARASTRSVLENFSVLTPPSSPMLSIPVYIDSSDFEYPPLDVSFDEPMEDAVNESIPTWYNNPRLFDDLMIMLRRLKPILVQGAWCRLHYCFSHE
jgi:hypothetical protein